jgi:hypothetical protein
VKAGALRGIGVALADNASLRRFPYENRAPETRSQRENVHFPRGNHLRTPLTRLPSGPTDPRFQGETSSVPHEEREHGYQKGRCKEGREARWRGEEGWKEVGVEVGRPQVQRRLEARVERARRSEACQARAESGVHEADAAV